MNKPPRPAVVVAIIVLWVLLGTATVVELLFVEDYEWLSVATAWLGGMVTYKLLDVYWDARRAHK